MLSAHTHVVFSWSEHATHHHHYAEQGVGVGVAVFGGGSGGDAIEGDVDPYF